MHRDSGASRLRKPAGRIGEARKCGSEDSESLVGRAIGRTARGPPVNFWDTSGIMALVVDEPRRMFARSILEGDDRMAVWWGSSIEYVSAVSRRIRDGTLKEDQIAALVHYLEELSRRWCEVQPDSKIKESAQTLVLRYPLRAADSLQLAAALAIAENDPGSIGFVCFDARLNAAANQEGFTVLDGEPPAGGQADQDSIGAASP